MKIDTNLVMTNSEKMAELLKLNIEFLLKNEAIIRDLGKNGINIEDFLYDHYVVVTKNNLSAILTKNTMEILNWFVYDFENDLVLEQPGRLYDELMQFAEECEELHEELREDDEALGEDDVNLYKISQFIKNFTKEFNDSNLDFTYDNFIELLIYFNKADRDYEVVFKEDILRIEKALKSKPTPQPQGRPQPTQSKPQTIELLNKCDNANCTCNTQLNEDQNIQSFIRIIEMPNALAKVFYSFQN